MRLLRFTLKLDAVVCAIAGVALVALPGILGRALGVPAVALVVTGLVLLAWAVRLWLLGSRGTISRRAAWTVIGINALWTAGSVVLAFGWAALTAAGTAVLLVQAVAVFAFADLEYVGLRRA